MPIIDEVDIFVQYWSYDDDSSTIYAYGVSEDKKTYQMKVHGFNTYCYVKLPTHIEWNQSKIRALQNYFTKINYKCNLPLNCILLYRKELYYANKKKNPLYNKTKKKIDEKTNMVIYDPENSKYIDIKSPFLFVNFASVKAMSFFARSLSKDLSVPGIGKIKLYPFEHNNDITPIIKFQVMKRLDACGWITFKGKRVKGPDGEIGGDKQTRCFREYNCKWTDVKSMDTMIDPPNLKDVKEVKTEKKDNEKKDNVKDEKRNEKIPNPKCKIVPEMKVICFDNEAYSKVKTQMPKFNRASDKIFQIGFCTSENRTEEKKYLYTLKKCNPIKDVIIKEFETEADLLIGFKNFIQEFNPNIIIGYNILGWDIKYMIQRSKQSFVNCYSEFIKWNVDLMKKTTVVGMDKKKDSGFQSKAFGKFEFVYIDCDRLYIDLYPWMRKSGYKLVNFQLKTVAQFFFPNDPMFNKKDLKHTDIFKSYEIGTPESMAYVGDYCVQDAYATLKIYKKTCLNLTFFEDSKTNRIQPFDLLVQGQQIKMLAQVLHYCYDKEIIVECRKVFPLSGYSGATVLSPGGNLLELIATLDFASLYPSIIRGYNIDYSKYVRDEDKIIDDEDCNIKEWDEHVNCEHDTIKRNKKEVICEHNKVKFLKKEVDGEGVIPELLDKLLSARKNTKGEIKQLKIIIFNNWAHLVKLCESFEYNGTRPVVEEFNEDKEEKLCIEYSKYVKNILKLNDAKEIKKNNDVKGIEKNNDVKGIEKRKEIEKLVNDTELLELFTVVLDKRQNSYKVSANSMYGAMGVKKGKLPLPAGAKTVTYIGRMSIQIVVNLIETVYFGVVVYGDTDSAMIQFPHLKTLAEIFAVCKEISAHTRRIFPAPMSLEFEGKIYKKFLILSKKRYIAIECNSLGIESKKRTEKGVLLSRRDNCNLTRMPYSTIATMIFNTIVPFPNFYFFTKVINCNEDEKEIRFYFHIPEQKKLTKIGNIYKLLKVKKLIDYRTIIPKKDKMFNLIKTGSIIHCQYKDAISVFSIINVINLDKYLNRYSDRKGLTMDTLGTQIVKNDKTKNEIKKSTVKITTVKDMKQFFERLDEFHIQQRKILTYIEEYVLSIFQYKYDFKNYIITKGLTKDVTEYKERPHTKCVDTDNCKKGTGSCAENSSNPAHVQLAQKKIGRGIPVTAGDRIEYVLTQTGGNDAKVKQYVKIECAEYYQEHRDVLRLDNIVYLRNQIMKPISDLLQIGLHTVGFMEKLLEYHMNKYRCMKHIQSAASSKIIFDD